MCNACGFYCCASDSFDGCGCDCPETDCSAERCPDCGVSFVPVVGDTCACDDDEGNDG